MSELGAYAAALDDTRWGQDQAKKNCKSLQSEIEFQQSRLGARLSRVVAPIADELIGTKGRSRFIADAARFDAIWRSSPAISAAFEDVCDAAQRAGTTTRQLRRLTAVLASQVGEAAEGPFSIMDTVAEELVGRDWPEWVTDDRHELGSVADRLAKAKQSLVSAPPICRVVVWLVYDRAAVPGMRLEAGRITFLRGEWALPNALDGGPNDFPERGELRTISEDVHWLEPLHQLSLGPESRIVLVRVDLGERAVAGAARSARQQVDALVSIAAEAGGVAWVDTQKCVVMADGQPAVISGGLNQASGGGVFVDEYGVGATAEILANASDQLSEALARGPMPLSLAEALTTLREARLTDHRDVLFHNLRAVTPRVATALEDHAMELISVTLGVSGNSLANALESFERDRRTDHLLARQIVAPFDGPWGMQQGADYRALENTIRMYDGDRSHISLVAAVSLRDEILRPDMPALLRADLEEALEASTDPEAERRLLEEATKESGVLRKRLRRVRNAINHGLPLSAAALNSARPYSERISRVALNSVLSWFKEGGSAAAALESLSAPVKAREKRIDQGVSLIEDLQTD
ncbi:hypothetical protein [Schumannella soli]|uniref:Uncharacterized protein n=1 Tax=Schumannella soli TaxID=2590779 RepID=A0A506YCA6_9MICO|nr:hypothetical protein [Schumannella soli]TPW78069.1 hypothetical protein FJ657_05430 [Schumannella soli]